jgi:hypothetical protein
MARIKAVQRQRTFGDYGHFLNHRQAVSHCGRFLVYDTRNTDSEIAKTTRIESLDLLDGTVRVVYDTKINSDHGPGVGAVVCHPLRSTVLFIHGLTNCDEKQPYAMTRRFGAWTSFDPLMPNSRIASLESRNLDPAISWGSLAGGTHAHSFSADGQWVSFTYNDARLPERRTVGFAKVDSWELSTAESHTGEAMQSEQCRFEERFDGVGWSALALVPEDPIQSAREECWVPNCVGETSARRLALIARVPSGSIGDPWIDEVYLAEFPVDADSWPSSLTGPIASHGQSAWRLRPPPGIRLRRLTDTTDAVHPGVQGPRHWLIASGCGRWIYTMMRDHRGVVRLVRVSLADGSIEWISNNQESITNPPAIDPAGRLMSYLVDKRLTILDLSTSQESGVDWDLRAFDELFGPVQFLKNSRELFWSARPAGSPWLQIWTARLQ